MADPTKDAEDILFSESAWEEELEAQRLISALLENAKIDAQGRATVTIALEDLLKIGGRIKFHVDEKRKRIELEEWLKQIKAVLKDAHQAYEGEYRKDVGAMRAVKTLGFTTGKREATYDNRIMLLEYLDLINGTIDFDTWERKEPMDKWQAIELLHKRYRNHSRDAIRQLLKRELMRNYSGRKGILPTAKD